MLQKNFIFAFFLILGGCSSAPMEQEGSSRRIAISAVEQLSFGKTAQAEVERLIGRPDQIVDLKRDLKGQQAWIYLEGAEDQKRERLGLLFDKDNGILLSATWSPKEGEVLHQKNGALSYFGGVGFKKKEVGLIAKHHYSDDSVFAHEQKGISLYVSGASQTVQSISFGQAGRRVLAREKK